MSATDSPLRYPGGKACLSEVMRSIIQHNSLGHCEYAEPFAGGAGLALRLLFSGVVSKIHLNDLDPAIWAFWHSVLWETEELANRIASATITIDEWRRQRDVLAKQVEADVVDLGYAAFFLNRTNRSGIIKGAGVIGGLDQKGNYLIDCRFNRADLAGRVRRIARYREKIRLTNLDAIEFLQGFDSAAKAPSIICIDPPYFSKGSSLYTNFYRAADHAMLAECAQTIRCPWVMTYDDAPQISELYAGHQKWRYSINYSVQRKRRGSELMIAAHNLSIPLSVTSSMSAA